MRRYLFCIALVFLAVLSFSSCSSLVHTAEREAVRIAVDEAAKTVEKGVSNPTVTNDTSDGSVISSTDVSASGTTSLSLDLTVYFVDVGQGDCEVLTCGGKNMVIDAGSGKDLTKMSNFMKKAGFSYFDVVVSTHPDEDHIGNLDTVITNWTGPNTVIYAPKITTTTVAFENFINAVKGKGLSLKTPVPGSSFNLGSTVCTILAPNSSSYQSNNNYSIVIRAVNGNNSFLLMGDAAFLSEGEILSKWSVKSDVLKVGHHGSATSTSQKFYDEVNPKYSVISVGVGNTYGHPSADTLSRISSSTIYRTDQNGTIVMKSDGNTIKVQTNF